MRVIKVLNNSLVLALDDSGNETILMGKGIGFRKASGSTFDPAEIEKTFVLKDRSITRGIIRLAAETDEAFFELSRNVIDYAKEHFGMQLMDHIYLSLTDHLAFCVKRYRENVILDNFYTLDMKKFNPHEFEVGKYAVELVNRRYNIDIPAEEAGNIAFHFINAQVNYPFNETNRQIRQLTDSILSLVRHYFHISYDEESVTYSRYVTHVRLFAQRLIAGQQLPEDESRLLFDQVAEVCRDEFECVKHIDLFVQERYGVSLTNQETLYLAVHIYRVVKERG